MLGRYDKLSRPSVRSHASQCETKVNEVARTPAVVGPMGIFPGTFPEAG